VESVMSWAWVQLNKAVMFTQEYFVMSEVPDLKAVHVALSLG
jgi:hypothetical protein